MATVAFDDEIHVHYAFIFVQSTDLSPELISARGGQANGLCGAAVPGVLSLQTGLHTGLVPLKVEYRDEEPALGPEWEDVVEVSFAADGSPLRLHSFDHYHPLPALPAGDYRVRYCAIGMDAAHDLTRMSDDPALDRYLLRLWPAPRRPDAVLRSGSAVAAYWHGVARETPPPPPPELAAERTARRERARARMQQIMERSELSRWGGRPPADRLRVMSVPASPVAYRDRDLADVIVALPAERQRAVARWAVHRSCAALSPEDAAWFSPALAALDRGAALPAPFDKTQDAWQVAFPGPRQLMLTIWHDADGRPSQQVLSPKAVTLRAVLAADAEDPAHAALEAVEAACSGAEPAASVLAGLRAEFGWQSPP